MGKKNFIFQHGPMGSGKTLDLMKARHNYIKQGKRVVVAKPSQDLKAAHEIDTRAEGFSSIPADALIGPDDEPYEKILRCLGASSLREAGVKCTFFDEIQFFNPSQIDNLYWNITRGEGIAVMAYGLNTDFLGRPFPGSAQAFARADEIRETVNVCECQRDSKAYFNTRYDDGVAVFTGAQISIDGIESTYSSLCHACYADELMKAIREGRPIDDGLKPTVDAILRFAGVLTTTDKNEV